jgi:hypothetical protein
VDTNVLLAHDGDDLGTQVVDPLRVCVKVADYYNSSSACVLICVKMIEIYVESVFATVCV